jgi:2'-5' RNA ligase
MIFAVVSIIDQLTWQTIMNSLPETRGIIALQNKSEFIHLSWVVGQQIEEKQAVQAIEELSFKQPAIQVKSGGMGIFGGEKPKITLNLARNKAMDVFHSKIWNKCQIWMKEIKQYYSPDLWMPHVTLIRNDIFKMDYPEFLSKSIYSSFQIKVPITNLAIIFKDDNSAGLLAQFPLKEK